MDTSATASSAVRRTIFGGNLYNTTELAGAFGDLGTLIPFVVGYIVVAGIDPVGILVSLGILKIFVGLYFKTPVPIQPMKAIGASAIANPATITPGVVWGSGLFSAIIWIILALTGAITWLEKITARPVMRGIMLGLGLSFMLEGLKMMSAQWLLAAVAFILAFLLLASKRLPAMIVLLCLGIASSLILTPDLFAQMRGSPVQFRLPQLVFGKIGWQEILLGAVMLGIPQVPLTLGNAVLGTVAENNQLFPERPITVKKVALDHGLINAVSFALGGIPVCHGAGGMAGHVRFGARTGGALVMLGVMMLALGLFFSHSVLTLFKMIPSAVLGVILFSAGLELATISWDVSTRRADLYVMLLTAAIAIVNIGIAFVAGLALFYAMQRKFVKA